MNSKEIELTRLMLFSSKYKEVVMACEILQSLPFSLSTFYTACLAIKLNSIAIGNNYESWLIDSSLKRFKNQMINYYGEARCLGTV